MNVEEYFHTYFAIDNHGCIICKNPKQPYIIETREYWICYTKGKYIITLPSSVLQNENITYPNNLSLNHLIWTHRKHADAMSAVIEIKNKLYLKQNTSLRWEEVDKIMRWYNLYTKKISLFSLCAIKMYEDIFRYGMVKINYPISEQTLFQIFPDATHGWWAMKFPQSHLIKYASINKILYVNLVTIEKKESYMNDHNYIYLGICIKWLGRLTVYLELDKISFIQQRPVPL